MNSSIISRSQRVDIQEKVIIIDNVRSAHNVGSIFRTADGAGVSHIYLLGNTPTPIDRFGRIQKEITKTALGATQTISWTHVQTGDEAFSLIARLQQQTFTIVSLEQSPQAVSLYDFTVPQKVAYIVGNEIDGVSSDLLAQSNYIVEIPMLGRKESLNVAVATGIVLFHQ